MQSKWFGLKEQAIQLRRTGFSIRQIEQKLGIPRSTLSGWFKNVKVPDKYKKILYENWKNALKHARGKAALWHKAQKEKRMEKARNGAEQVLDLIDADNIAILELTLALLYLGEGTKKNDETAIGNSDPLILKFFITILKKVYNVKDEQIRWQLNLRADQNPEEMKIFWAKELKLPIENCRHVSLDSRTRGKKTYDHYKGVCQVRCGKVEIERKLVYLSILFCKKVIEKYLGS